MQAFQVEHESPVTAFSREDSADSRHLFEPLLDIRVVESRGAPGFDRDRDAFGASEAMSEIADCVRGYDLALADDDYLFADLLDFRQDVGAQDDGVIARERFDERPRFRDLLGIEAGCGLVEDKDVGVVDDRLCESDALAVAFRQLVDELLADICDRSSARQRR